MALEYLGTHITSILENPTLLREKCSIGSKPFTGLTDHPNLPRTEGFPGASSARAGKSKHSGTIYTSTSLIMGYPPQEIQTFVLCPIQHDCI
jgi:hypothetical protein